VPTFINVTALPILAHADIDKDERGLAGVGVGAGLKLTALFRTKILRSLLTKLYNSAGHS
jgi:hypothetical protein